MQWSDIGKMAATAAPLIGGLLGGPAGTAVGSMIATKFGVPATPDDIGRVLQGDPEAYIKLKQIESDERIALQDMASKQIMSLAQAEVADRDSARKREIAIHDFVPAVLAYGALMLFIILALAELFIEVPVANRDLVIGTTKTLEILLGTVFGYYLGGSIQAKRSTELLAKTTGSAP